MRIMRIIACQGQQICTGGSVQSVYTGLARPVHECSDNCVLSDIFTLRQVSCDTLWFHSTAFEPSFFWYAVISNTVGYIENRFLNNHSRIISETGLDLELSWQTYEDDPEIDWRTQPHSPKNEWREKHRSTASIQPRVLWNEDSSVRQIASFCCIIQTSTQRPKSLLGPGNNRQYRFESVWKADR